jgi:hypothetical protein
MDYRTTKDNLAATQRTEDLERQATQRTEDLDREATQRTEDIDFRTAQLDRNQNSKLDAELTRQENQAERDKSLFDMKKEEVDRQKEERTQEKNAVLAGQSADQIFKFEMPEEGLNDTEAGEFNQLVANTNNSPLSIAGALNPYTPEVAQNVSQDIQKFASGQDLSNKENILGGANILVSKNTKGIGEIIPASVEGQPHPFPNAPEKFRTGEYEIVSKEAYDVVPNADGSLAITVLVRVKDKKGRITKYLAPVTEGREANGLALNINAEEFTGGFAGMVHYSSEMSKNKDAL